MSVYYLFFCVENIESIFPKRTVRSFNLDDFLLHRQLFLLCNLCNRLYIYFWKYNTISTEVLGLCCSSCINVAFYNFTLSNPKLVFVKWIKKNFRFQLRQVLVLLFPHIQTLLKYFNVGLNDISNNWLVQKHLKQSKTVRMGQIYRVHYLSHSLGNKGC